MPVKYVIEYDEGESMYYGTALDEDGEPVWASGKVVVAVGIGATPVEALTDLLSQIE